MSCVGHFTVRQMRWPVRWARPRSDWLVVHGDHEFGGLHDPSQKRIHKGLTLTLYDQHVHESELNISGQCILSITPQPHGKEM